MSTCVCDRGSGGRSRADDRVRAGHALAISGMSHVDEWVRAAGMELPESDLAAPESSPLDRLESDLGAPESVRVLPVRASGWKSSCERLEGLHLTAYCCQPAATPLGVAAFELVRLCQGGLSGKV